MPRKLIAKIYVTLDGFVATEDGDDSWAHEHFGDPRGRADGVEIIAGAGTHVMGRKSYEIMSPYWPTSDDPDFARPMNEIPKVVFSSTLAGTESHWERTTFVSGDLATEIERLKNDTSQTDKPVLVHGGAQLISGLARLKLVDEYRLFVAMRALGAGLPLFTSPVRLKLVHATTYENDLVGVTLVHAD